MQQNKENLIVKMTFDFSLKLIEYCELLQNEKKYLLSNQLFKCGTSIGANIREAQNAESMSDFIHKMKIAAKEADESDYWLELCLQSPNIPNPDHLCDDVKSINKVLSKIISTTKKKRLTQSS